MNIIIGMCMVIFFALFVMNASNKQTALKNKISFVVRSIDESNADIRDHRRQEYRKHHSIASEVC